MDAATDATMELIEGEEPLAGSLVELIVAASECSEDAFEIEDLLDDLLDSGRVDLDDTPEA